MTVLGVLMILALGILLMAFFDTMVYHEPLSRALLQLFPRYIYGPSFMIGAALLLAVWQDTKESEMMRMATAWLSRRRRADE